MNTTEYKKDLYPTLEDLSVGKLAQIIGGEVRFDALPPVDGDASPVSRIVTDSRDIQPGEIFWTLPGKQYDGADFCQQAWMQGAQGIVSHRPVPAWAGRWTLQVPDATLALWRLAAWKRSQFSGETIAVVGSAGKTTTREMIHTVLDSQLSGIASGGNFNNQIGVPLSMLRLDPLDDYAVFELASSAPGELDPLTRLCQPTICVVTNLGDAHLGGFGTRAKIAEEKSQILALLPPDGWAVLPGDDPVMRKAAKRCPARVLWFGRGKHCDIQATHIRVSGGHLMCQIEGNELRVPVWGRHFLDAVLAAFATGTLLEIDSQEIAAALATFKQPAMRCEIRQCENRTIIDDTYNSSPMAMAAALALLRDIDFAGRRVVVCGDMGELGTDAKALHRETGQCIVTDCGPSLLFVCGQFASDVADGALAAGMPPQAIVAREHRDDLVVPLRERLREDDVILVKGCRTMQMEKIVVELLPAVVSRAA